MSNGPIYTVGEQIYSAEGIVTYRGVVAPTNEAVYIHALPIDSVELYDRALKLFRAYSVERPILNLFAFEGQPYVITRPGPEQTNFRSWLLTQIAMQDKKLSSPPIIWANGREHPTPRGFEALGDRTITADPFFGVLPEQAGEFTRISGPVGKPISAGPDPRSSLAYGPATRVFQSPRNSVGPANHDLAGGELTKIYGPKETAHQFAEERADANSEGGGQEKKAEEPTIQISSAASDSPDTGSGAVDDKQPTKRLPLVLVLIFSSLIVVAVVAYLALWAN